MTLRLSNSEMKEYRRCKRMWYLGSYRRLKKIAREEAGTPLVIGNEIHDALAAYYESRMPRKRKVVDPVAFAEARYAKRIEEVPEWTAEILAEKELVTIMLQGYMEWLEETGADADLKIQGAESMVEVKLVEGVNLISKLDAPVERISDGAKLALEHKSTKTFNMLLPEMKLNTQYLTEHLARFLAAMEAGATADEAHDQCQGVLLNMLRKVKRTPRANPPFYMREDVIHNIHELRAHWKHVYAVAQEILATTAALDAGASHQIVAPPNPTRDCSWDCAFFAVCPLADDGSNFEGALEGLYEDHDPLERYLGAEPLAPEAA